MTGTEMETTGTWFLVSRTHRVKRRTAVSTMHSLENDHCSYERLWQGDGYHRRQFIEMEVLSPACFKRNSLERQGGFLQANSRGVNERERQEESCA